jgi:hypothetical protein
LRTSMGCVSNLVNMAQHRPFGHGSVFAVTGKNYQDVNLAVAISPCFSVTPALW